MGAPAPNFLPSSRALSNFMRLSLEKAAHAALLMQRNRKFGPFQVHVPAPFPNGENVDEVRLIV
jgi:hypothetical protein